MVDIEVDDIYSESEKKKKKKIKSKPKGKRVELELVKALNKRFDKLLNKHPEWGRFSRTIGSGNRWGQQVHLSRHATQTYTGDIACPENFRFVVESKGGYNDIDLNAAFDGGHKELDAFLEQVSNDAKRSGRDPMLVWKKDRKPRLVFVKTKELSISKIGSRTKIEYCLVYRDWTAVSFDFFCGLNDSYFFSSKEIGDQSLDQTKRSPPPRFTLSR